MKEYVFLYKGGDPEWMKNTSDEEKKATMDKWGAWMANLQEQDKLSSSGSPLQFDGKRLTSDGVATDIAAAELKEMVTGYSVVRATDYAEAVEIAKVCPIFEYPGCSVDIREVPQMG